MKEIGIYVHIPFCVSKCFYCDFCSYVGKEEKKESYVEAVCEEIQTTKEGKQDIKVTTIYLGGGTPSYLEADQIKKILETIKREYRLAEEVEITIEVNPKTVTKEKLETYKEAGINRISIGLQSTHNTLLKQIGRIHTYEQFLQSYRLVTKMGFKNRNVDLMLALPNQTIEELKESVEQVILLQPEHISIYSLILEEETPMLKWIEEGKMKLPKEEEERQMYWFVKRRLEEEGYCQYEISNFAKPKKESKHNLACWEQKEYLGFGVAAHSYWNLIRYSNTQNLEEYLQQAKHKQIQEKRIIQEIQSIQDQEKEFILLGLRKLEGISILAFKQKFGKDLIPEFKKEWGELSKKGLIQRKEDRILLTNKGLDFANLVWEQFV